MVFILSASFNYFPAISASVYILMCFYKAIIHIWFIKMIYFNYLKLFTERLEQLCNLVIYEVKQSISKQTIQELLCINSTTLLFIVGYFRVSF